MTTRLAVAAGISDIGNSFRYMAIITILALGTDSATAALHISIMTAAALLPNILFGRQAGLVVRRIGPKRALLISECGRAVTTLAFPWLPFWGMCGANVVFSSFTALYAAAFGSFLPLVSPESRLLKVNSTVRTIRQTAGILAPSLGGAGTLLLGPVYAFVVDSFSFILNAAVIEYSG